jgi:hypothetical protein
MAMGWVRVDDVNESVNIVDPVFKVVVRFFFVSWLWSSP